MAYCWTFCGTWCTSIGVVVKPLAWLRATLTLGGLPGVPMSDCAMGLIALPITVLVLAAACCGPEMKGCAYTLFELSSELPAIFKGAYSCPIEPIYAELVNICYDYCSAGVGSP